MAKKGTELKQLITDAKEGKVIIKDEAGKEITLAEAAKGGKKVTVSDSYQDVVAKVKEQLNINIEDVNDLELLIDILSLPKISESKGVSDAINGKGRKPSWVKKFKACQGEISGMVMSKKKLEE
ncbi:hypothetical protein [Echinicola shivajiensis]|uniref:hypothetical protein n=1 Tax=Echinicola shivajiensis TaxID=1035916 RepID=UPI001BFC22D5|nr:hypothetical protein [Echinicola shivajiensis]